MSKYMRNRQYGYLTPENDDVFIENVPNQQVGGYSVGIMYIENVNYPFLPGNVVNANTYDFPVRMLPVKGLTNDRLFNADPAIADDLIALARHMVENEGVRAISSACGFFGNYHDQVASAVDVPVALSSLVQLPWINSMLRPCQKIGILTASAKSMSDDLFRACGIKEHDNVVIQGIDHTEEMLAVVDMRGSMDNGIARREILDAAWMLRQENEDLGAILLECSDMPPYASEIQRITQLPVFDFITLIKYMHNAVNQKPYSGWI